MKRLPLLLLAVASGLALLGAAPPSETLLEQGNEALQKGDLTRAIELYEQAEPRADDPGLVTMNLAQAKYARAVHDSSENDLFEAEQLYRCLLAKDDPRRAAALLGLGNCLLQKVGTRDARSALKALEVYEQCLTAAQEARADQLAADAQHNIERARLLLHQIRRADDEKKPPEADPDKGTQPKPPDPKPPSPQQHPGDPKDPGVRPKPSGPGDQVQPQDGDKPIEADVPPNAGKGNLRPVPDQPDLPPLSADEAKEHLKQANERIWRERHQHRLGLAKPPAVDVRDW